MSEKVLMPFGKHKGLPLDYIAKEYPAYHRWAIKNNILPLCSIKAEIIIKSRPVRKIKNADRFGYGYDHCEIYEYGEN
jgi:hypothetical protein